MQIVATNLKAQNALICGATAIAMHWVETADAGRVDRQLQWYADSIRRRVRGQQIQAILAHLHEMLFETVGLRGNEKDYFNPSNSFLPAVLSTKKGLPITLSIIYKTVAERLGLRVYGVGLPGHFLVAVEDRSGYPLLVDTFSGGRTLTVNEARARLQEEYDQELEWTDDYLKPVSNRHWLTRITQNLLQIFGENGQYADVAAILEIEMLMWPEQAHLKRDLALVLARIGDWPRVAGALLAEYLRENPGDPQEEDLKGLIDILAS
jgi:regulator of sirC expression with transglutaminase-like and TPR domain